MTIYSEFLGALNENNKEPKDIVFIGSDDGEYEIWFPEFINQITREELEFKELPYDVVVVFSNGDRFIRVGHPDAAGYYWLLVKAFIKQVKTKPIINIVVESQHDSLKDHNKCF